MRGDQRVGLAAEAFMLGFPLVTGIRQSSQLANDGVGPIAPAGFNAFSHMTERPGPKSHFISLNPDVRQSMAEVDLTPSPVVMRVPECGDRYWVVMFIDAWRNTFAYVGRRTSGGRGGEFVLVPPGWPGDVPAALARIDAPTRLVAVLARFACAGPADAAVVGRLQGALELHPLDPEARRPEGPPERSKQVCDDLRFWEELRIWLRAYPPSRPEQDHARRFASLGLLDDPSPYIDPDPGLTWSLRSGLRSGRDELERMAQAGRALTNGWAVTPHALDFNLDHLGPGTRDGPDWRMADRAQARLARAMAARAPFGVTHGYESIQATCATDADGHQLTGAHRYLLTLPPVPTSAFWSLTMYDAPEYYLVDNPLHRYSLGSRDQGLRPDPDGAVHILIQSDPPADQAELDNWLPAPIGDFRPALRVYQPGDDLLDGTYVLPPIHRVG